MTTVCPVCARAKSPRALLCLGCRRAASAAGVSLLLAQSDGSLNPPPPRNDSSSVPAVAPRTPGQNRAYHGMTASLAGLRGVPTKELKTQALAHASRLFGRAVESSGELNELEMSDLLDWLEAELDAARGSSSDVR